MNKTIKENSGIKGKFRVIKTCALTGKVLEETPFYENIIVNGTDTGLNLILDRLNGKNTYSLNINHLDIGDDNTTPTVSDTALGNAVARSAKVTGVISGSDLTLRFFFASADLANGTYYEVGTFIDGTASVDTGKMFNHALFGSAYTKGTNENTTIEVVFNIS
jgi:hypothetical protein